MLTAPVVSIIPRLSENIPILPRSKLHMALVLRIHITLRQEYWDFATLRGGLGSSADDPPQATTRCPGNAHHFQDSYSASASYICADLVPR